MRSGFHLLTTRAVKPVLMISVMIDDSAAVVEPWKKEYLPTMLAKYREYQTTSKKRKGDLVISSLQRKVDPRLLTRHG